MSLDSRISTALGPVNQTARLVEFIKRALSTRLNPIGTYQNSMELLPTDTATHGRLAQEVLPPISPKDFVSELVKSGRLVYLDAPDSRKFFSKSAESERLNPLPIEGLENDPTPPSSRENYLAVLGPISLPARVERLGKVCFDWYIYSRFFSKDKTYFTSKNPVSSILTYGLQRDGISTRRQNVPLVRLHSGCHTGDILSSMRCDCGPQLHEALRRIVQNRSGALVYIASHEGRGIGLWGKAFTYILQDRGYDTYTANEMLGFPPDAREYSDALVALKYVLPSLEVKLLSNNPEKRAEIESSGIKVVQMSKLVVGVNSDNRNYLASKIRKGHLISSLDLNIP